jgi:hypothetical protein
MIATNNSLSHHIVIVYKVLQCFKQANIKIKVQKGLNQEPLLKGESSLTKSICKPEAQDKKQTQATFFITVGARSCILIEHTI